jgi:hypothetical protein
MLPASRPLYGTLLFTAIAAGIFSSGCTKKPVAHPPLPQVAPTADLGAYVPAEVPNTLTGFQSQVDELIRVGKMHDQSAWRIALETFALPAPGTWLEANFAPQHVTQLIEDYPKVRDGHLGHISWVLGHNVDAPGFTINVELSEMPAPPSDAGFESVLPRPLHSVQLQNFRLTPSANAGSMPPSWVSSFAYVDGHFRVIGGTYPFWAEKLTPIRGPMSLPAITLNGLTVQGMAFQHDQKGGGIVGVVQLEIKVESDGSVSKVKVLSGDQEFVEGAKSYIMAAHFPAMPDIPQLANTERKWEFEVAFFGTKP